MGAVKGIFRIVVGLIFGLLTASALIPALAAFMTETNTAPGWVFYAVVLLVAVLAFFAPSIRRAFGRGFLALGAAVFALPLSAMLLSGRAMSETVGTAPEGTEAMAVVGSGLAGALFTGASAFVGFFFGSILMLIGLVLALGGRREVVVVHHHHGDRGRPDPMM